MTNYVFKHSDPASGSFLVQADQIDGTSRPGNAALYTNPVSGLTAVSASTSLVLGGQGIVDYGEMMQNNLIYMMEHFAFATRPLTPVQGQIWYKNAAGSDPSYPSDPSAVGLYLWNGSIWAPIITGATGALDMGGARVTDVGDAVANGDAVSRIFGDNRYLQTAGGNTTGIMAATSGSWTFGAGVPVSVTAAPTTSLHVTNKTYVDTLNSAETSFRTAADANLQGQINTLSGQLGGFVVASGDTFTGTLAFDPAAALTFGNGSGVVSFGLRRLQLVADPIANTDATTRLYVDTAISTAISGISTGGTADGVVTGGTFDDVSGILTLQRSLGLPDVVVTGEISPLIHGHASGEVTHDLSTPYSRSRFATTDSSDAGYPVLRLDQLLLAIDQTLNDVTRPVERLILTGDSTTTTFSVTDTLGYTVGSNRLQVFVDGVKKYADIRGQSKVVFAATDVGMLTVVPGLSSAPRQFSITVDGGAADVITVTPFGGYTYLQMTTDIQTALTTASVPVQLRVAQFQDRIEYDFISNTSGSSSSVTVSYAAGELFTVVTATAPVDTAGVTYAYSEVGNAGALSTSITFATAPTTGALIECLVFPA